MTQTLNRSKLTTVLCMLASLTFGYISAAHAGQNGHNKPSDMDILKAKAAKGDAEAEEQLGEHYELGVDGLGLEQEGLQDYAKAMNLFHQAADQGYAPAQLDIAETYENGEGVTKDYAEAMKWYIKAALQGNVNAEYRVGEKYESGEGVKQDQAEAMKWFLKAATQGDISAQYHVGEKYRNGEGVKQNYAEAMKWFLKAANRGDAPSSKGISRLYQDGDGVKQSWVEAYFWDILARGEKLTYDNATLSQHLTSEQITSVEQRACEWRRSHREYVYAYPCSK